MMLMKIMKNPENPLKLIDWLRGLRVVAPRCAVFHDGGTCYKALASQPNCSHV